MKRFPRLFYLDVHNCQVASNGKTAITTSLLESCSNSGAMQVKVCLQSESESQQLREKAGTPQELPMMGRISNVFLLSNLTVLITSSALWNRTRNSYIQTPSCSSAMMRTDDAKQRN